MEFAEHVFYRFRDGRIERVWSLIDTDAVRDQMGSGARRASAEPVDPA